VLFDFVTSASQVIGWEDCLQSYLYCVELDIKHYSIYLPI